MYRIYDNSEVQEISKSTRVIIKISSEDGNLNCFKGSFTCAMIKRKFPTMPVTYSYCEYCVLSILVRRLSSHTWTEEIVPLMCLSWMHYILNLVLIYNCCMQYIQHAWAVVFVYKQGVSYSQKFRVKRGFPNYLEVAISQFGSAKNSYRN
jgi:hypothetical protein